MAVCSSIMLMPSVTPAGRVACVTSSRTVMIFSLRAVSPLAVTSAERLSVPAVERLSDGVVMDVAAPSLLYVSWLALG